MTLEPQRQTAGAGAGDEAPLVFIHIPKTGGTTLDSLLHHHYSDSFAEIRTSDTLDDAEVFRERVMVTLGDRRLRAVKGHVTVGVSDLLPADARYVTLLRDPVDRTLSHFGHVTRGGRWRPRWLPPPPPGLTLAECVEGRYVPDNLQTRMLCGLVSPWDELPPAALEQAKRNLAGFAYVGTTERFEEFISLLNVELGWPTVAYKFARVGSRRVRAEDLSAGDLRVVEKANLLDRQLHAYAGELLAKALERAGPEVGRELDVLEQALSRARGGAAAPLRSLPLETRVELALKERELARARADVRKHARCEARLRKRVARLEGPLANPDGALLPND
jgi:hypothetical protein